MTNAFDLGRTDLGFDFGNRTEEDGSTVLPRLVDAFWHATQAVRQEPSFATAHRWRYAIPLEPLEDRCLYDPDLGLGACGDWCSGPRVEGAFLSGMAMGGRILAQLTQERS